MIRATGNGVTALIDAKGRLTARIPQFERAVLLGSFQPMRGETPFMRWGNWPALTFCGAILLLLLGKGRKNALQ
jgi:apolipoprotein N-acyltransferase